ncbi:hypothetical protein KGO06_02970 [Patescibacteria group bacterium]|nr:hypothetical protein [Patescibacteria group bacterium]
MLSQYPKLTAILLTYPLAYFLFAAFGYDTVHAVLEPFGIGGVFIAGSLYTYGFTASSALFIIPAFTPDYSPVFIALVGGIGATVADLTIFKLLKGNLGKEIDALRKIPAVRRMLESRAMRPALVRDLAGFLIIMSPFPDEIGVAFLTLARVNDATFRIISFTANVIGIYLLASAGVLLY